MSRSKSNSESQILPDVRALRTDLQRVQDTVALTGKDQQTALVERMKQEAIDREARHAREMEQTREVSGIKVEIANVASSVTVLAKSVEGIVKGMEAQNTDLKQLLGLASTVNSLKDSHVKSEDDRTWMKRYIFGIFATMGLTLLLGVIAAVYGVKIPTEPVDAAIVHHHHEATDDPSDVSGNK